jgi:hypothetical protein
MDRAIDRDERIRRVARLKNLIGSPVGTSRRTQSLPVKLLS